MGEENRQAILNRVRRWGGITSDALLDPSCQFFTVPEIDGMIGYRREQNCAIIFGDPVSSFSDAKILALAFKRFCYDQHLSVLYLMTSPQFSKWAKEHVCEGIVEFGETPFFNPQIDPAKAEGINGSLLRRKRRHALHEGTVVKEYLSTDDKLEQRLEQAGLAWLAARRGPQIHISNVRLFADRFGKRWFYAQKEGNIVGVLVLNQLQAFQGWLLNHLMITPDAPHGTPELLILTAFDTLRNEGCQYVTVGSVPNDKLGEIEGLSRCSSWLARLTYATASWVFRLRGHKKFWEKFHPNTQPSYLLFGQAHIGLREILGLMRALNVIK